MNLFLKKVFLLFSCLLMVMISGCGSGGKAEGTRVITDDLGREVRLSAHPSRIISLTYGTDEILLGLVDISRVKGLSRYAGNGDITFTTKEQAEKVGNKVDTNPETILALKPDLVIASTSVPSDTLEVLKHSGIPVYTSLIASNWEEMEIKVRGVAKAVNEEKAGEAMVSEMNRKRQALDEKLSVIPKEKERTALALSFRGILGKKGTLFSEILSMAHVKDGAAVYDVPRGTNAYLSNEILPEINPDILLMPVWKVKEGDNENEFAGELMENPAFQDVKAVKNHELVRFPEKYKYVMSQHSTDAMEAAARAVYPELFEDSVNSGGK